MRSVNLEHVAAIPGRDGASVVVADGRLPAFTADTAGMRDALDGFAPLIGRPVFLRVGAFADPQILFEFDRGDGDTIPFSEAEA